MGAMILDLGAANMIGVVLMAYVFGWLAGAGLPPTATYIIGAIVIVRPLQELGVNPWIAHFFVFLLSVWGELSPPTSLTAAVSARIADASFMRTMYEALKICAPITLMTFAIFTRSDMVVTPGWSQVAATIVVFVGTSGIAFAIFGRFVAHAARNALLCAMLAAASFVVLLHPDDMISMGAAAVVLPATLIGVWRHRQFGPAMASTQVQPVEQEKTPQVAGADLRQGEW
jgi:TRAP-type uncharacterized transport system fused permease subunit